MQAIGQIIQAKKPEHPESMTVNTTLYELIETIRQEIDPGEDRLLSAIVLNLFKKGRIMLSDSIEKSVTDFSIN